MIVGIGFLLLLAACGKEDNTGELDTIPEMLQVEIQTDPDASLLKPNEAFTIRAKVTQGEENVNDANEVRFEFWKEGQSSEENEMIDGEFQADGVYAIEKVVEEPGKYYVIAHVTARDMHVMPQKELLIGEVEVSAEDEHKHDQDHGEDSETSDHGHHSSSGINLHVMVDSKVEKDKKIALVGHITKEEQPVTGAEVEFEVWKEGAEKHEYIPAEEGAQGEYTATHTFAEAGEYHINLHFVKEDLHDHLEKVITVE